MNTQYDEISNFATTLRDIMKLYAYSQRRIADMCDCSSRTVQGWLNERHGISTEIAIELMSELRNDIGDCKELRKLATALWELQENTNLHPIRTGQRSREANISRSVMFMSFVGAIKMID